MGPFAGQVAGKALCLFDQVLANPLIGGVKKSDESNPEWIPHVDRAAKIRFARRYTEHLYLPIDL